LGREITPPWCEASTILPVSAWSKFSIWIDDFP
jgi:hypothetical protein